MKMPTLKELKGRCVISDETGCWIWKGAYTGRKINGVGTPCVSLGFRDSMRATRAAYMAANGDVGSLLVFRDLRVCNDRRCINPAHMMSGDRAAAGQMQRESGAFTGLLPKIKAGRANGRVTAKLDMERAREIRLSSESGPVLAKKYGVHTSLIYQIKNGNKWKEEAPNASVFSWRPAA